jgi:hypothetical protein
MIKIIWDNAPVWATHAGIIDASLLSGGLDNGLVWYNSKSFCRICDDRQRPFSWGNLSDGDARNNPSEYQVKFSEERPAPWRGEGLPTAGTICERYTDDGVWVKTKVIAHSELGCVAAYQDIESPYHLGWCKRDSDFRPILTPEQIEARNREAAITHIATIMGKDPERPGIREKAAIIYDAGYRKVTP